MSTTGKILDRDEQAGRIMEALSTAAGIAEDLLRDGVDDDETETLRRVIAACDDLSQLSLDTFPGVLDGSDDDAASAHHTFV